MNAQKRERLTVRSSIFCEVAISIPSFGHFEHPLTNILAKISDTLSTSQSSDGMNVVEVVQDAKIDIDVWFMCVLLE